MNPNLANIFIDNRKRNFKLNVSVISKTTEIIYYLIGRIQILEI